MMSIGRSSRRENLLWVTGVEPMLLIRTHLANHIRASSREEWLHQQARHMTLHPDRNHRRNAKSALDAGAPSTHDPLQTLRAVSCKADVPIWPGLSRVRYLVSLIGLRPR